MPTHADWLASDTYRDLAAKAHEATAAKRARALHDATQAQTVVDHVGWQAFLTHLTAEIATRQAHYDTMARQILTGADVGDVLTAQKVLLNQIDGQIKGLTLARDFIPALIQRGQSITPLIT